MRRLRTSLVAGACLALATAAIVSTGSPASSTPTTHFSVTPLIADRAGFAPHVDTNLVNPWGLAFAPGSPLWAADNGTDKSTLYTGGVHGSSVSTVPLVVRVIGGEPTGQVFNGTNGFVVHDGATSGSALFIFSSEAGDITGWSPNVGGGDVAVIGAHVKDAVFKGLAMVTTGAGSMLYATDFHHNKVDVFDDHFHMVSMPGAFTDPNLPAGYAPFGIQTIGNAIYVSYAVQDSDRHDDVGGHGHGILDMYSTSGVLMHRLVTHRDLDSPWGMVIAPPSFGSLAGSLLVGNFGDGHIHAYDPMTGAAHGTVRMTNGQPVWIEGLWGLIPGNGTFGGTDELVFSAGSDHEAHGLVGTIDAAG
jgi:uncharacterized protein (TIGR03118 family)